MIPTMLLMLAAGIGLTQAASDPKAVTLPWLRLGGIIAVTLLAVTAAALFANRDAGDVDLKRVSLAFAAIAAPAVVQLMATQLGARLVQRIAAAAFFLVGIAALTWWTFDQVSMKAAMDQAGISRPPDMPGAIHWAILFATFALSAGLLGGFLMTMLLGHAYLTAGNEMTQAPFRRLILLLAVLLALRLAASVALGLVPWLSSARTGSQLWVMMMMTARYAVGLFVTGVFTYMIHDCVQRRANQSATGILYVAGVLIIIGEWSALSLFDSTGFLF